jgi:zinc transport system substrate-binding protein
MNKNLVFFLFLIAVLLACGKEQPKSATQTSGKAKVAAVNYPLYYFGKKIGGDLIEIPYLIPEGVDPAYWTPDERALDHFQSADLILANGANYAKWMDKVALPASKIINTSTNFKEKYTQIEEGVTHSHGPGGEHEHLGYAFTTWLDFTLAIEQARAVKQAFSDLLPDHKADFEAQFNQMEKQLSLLDSDIKNTVSSASHIMVIFSHPVYQYLVNRYGINGKSLHWEPDKMPDKEMWNELRVILKTHPANWMLWEDQPLPEIVKKLKTMNIESVVFNPCGNIPESGDFLSVMQKNVDELKLIYK